MLARYTLKNITNALYQIESKGADEGGVDGRTSGEKRLEARARMGLWLWMRVRVEEGSRKEMI